MPLEPVWTFTLELGAEIVTLDIARARRIIVQIKWSFLSLITVAGSRRLVQLAAGKGLAGAMGESVFLLHATLASIGPLAGAVAMVVVESGRAIA